MGDSWVFNKDGSSKYLHVDDPSTPLQIKEVLKNAQTEQAKDIENKVKNIEHEIIPSALKPKPSVTKGGRLKCPICAMYFTTQTAYDAHCNIKHGA